MSSASSEDSSQYKASLTIPHSGGMPLIMGIVNATPDSFYPASRSGGSSARQAADRALRLVEDGADIIDIGGESTRPGSDAVEAEEERRRVAPVVEMIRRESTATISVDTQKADVARAALDAGAHIVNDVSALRADPAMAYLIADRNVPVVLMHMRGTPKTMQQAPHYDDPLHDVLRELRGFASRAESQGVRRENIIIDPGIGFGKRLQDNLALIRGTRAFASLGYRLLLGASRKSFIGQILSTGADTEAPTPRPVEERLAGTLAVHLFAALLGADILRVHDVRETRDVLRVLSVLLEEDAP